MNSSRMHRERIACIDRAIRAGQYPNSRQVAREFGVAHKTVQRDIGLMRRLGAPLEYDPKRHGYYYSEPLYAFPSITLTESDVFAFAVNEQILKQYQNTPYYEEIRKVIDKIISFLPEEIFHEDQAAIFSFACPPTSPVKKQQFEILQKAAAAEKRVKIKYYSPHTDTESERLVDPYAIRHQHGTWYLVAFCHLRNDVRIFAFNRIREIEPTGVDFYKPSSFSIEKLLADSFGIYLDQQMYHVKLKFSPYEARWIRERQWHKSQCITETESGALILELDVDGLADVKRWVLQYGGEVEVLEPAALREEVGAEVKKLAEIYFLNGEGGVRDAE